MASQRADLSGGPAMKKPRVEAASWSFMDDLPDAQHDHAFSIANFSQKMKMTTGKCLLSGVFTFMVKDKQTSWNIQCFPNGNREANKGFLSVFLSPTRNTQLPTTVEFALSVINKGGEKSISETGIKKTFAVGNDGEVYGHGRGNLVPHDDLQDPDLNLLPDDVLTVHCALKVCQEDDPVVTRSGTNCPLLSQVSNVDIKEPSSIGKCVENGYINGQFTDCVIVCQGREFNCHKMILAGRSPVFNATFTHDMEESKSGRIVINDLDADTVGKMLTYIYSGKISGTGQGKISGKMLLAAADKYNLPGLKSLCEDALSKTMTIANVLDMLLLADFHKAERVKALAIDFVIKNAQEIVSQEGWSKKLEKFPSILSDMFKTATKK